MLIDEDSMRGLVKEIIQRQYKTQKEASEDFGISETYLSECLRGVKPIPIILAKRLGFSRGYYYKKIGVSEEC